MEVYSGNDYSSYNTGRWVSVFFSTEFKHKGSSYPTDYIIRADIFSREGRL